jgi:hypothetical protein
MNTVTFDSGWSRRKASYFNPINGGGVGCFAISPYEAEIYIEPQLEDALSTEKLWIEYGNRQFLLGEIARDKPGGSILTFGEKKYERAVRFTLAALGYLRKTVNLDWATPLRLGLLLPFEEYQDKESAEELLRYHLSGYQWCGETVRFNLEEFICCPEGAGIYAKCGSETVRRSLVIILGYQDATALHVLDGDPDDTRSQTVLLGMSTLIQSIKKGYSVRDELRLAQALVEVAEQKSDQPLQQLIQANDENIRANELTRLKNAIQKSRKQYLGALRKWLERHLYDVDEVLISGGTALYLKPEIDQWFKEWAIQHRGYPDKANWCPSLIKETQTILGTKDKYELHRSADNVGFLLDLIAEEP